MAEEKDISIEPPSSLESMDREDSQIPEKARGIRMEEKAARQTQSRQQIGVTCTLRLLYSENIKTCGAQGQWPEGKTPELGRDWGWSSLIPAIALQPSVLIVPQTGLDSLRGQKS
jgi:hypothetical protein